MIEPGELFPRALGKPIGLREVNPNIQASRSMKINPWINSTRPAATITKTKSDYQFLSNGKAISPKLKDIIKCGSYPYHFQFLNNAWERIGNSVPPMLMKAIATQIRHKLWGGVELEPYPKTMDYLQILEDAWQQHLAPREPDAPTVISTFAGGGGSSLGYSMAGYRELLAVEWDNNAVETFRLNFPDVPVYHGDIAKLSVDECMELAGLSEPGELDLLDGSPPCQGFSTAGKRNLDDDRNQLFREYVRLLRGLKPKVFVMENVSGMVKGKMKLIFAEIMKVLKASGYRVSARKLNAMYFYVPQSRERIIFIGVRKDLGIEPGHPKAESRPVTVKEALKGANRNFLPHIPDYNTKLGKCCQQLKQGQNGETLFGKNWGFQLVRLYQNKPSPTISKGGGQQVLFTRQEIQRLVWVS